MKMRAPPDFITKKCDLETKEIIEDDGSRTRYK